MATINDVNAKCDALLMIGNATVVYLQGIIAAMPPANFDEDVMTNFLLVRGQLDAALGGIAILDDKVDAVDEQVDP